MEPLYTVDQKQSCLGISDVHPILQLYMAMGGIPHYLKEVEAGKSATQNIDEICFSPSGLLNNEFSLLYPALFDNPEDHIKLIRLLASKRKGLSRKEIVTYGDFPNGGNTSRLIEDLIHSGFVSTYYAFGKKRRDVQYRLTDEYTLFYLKFIEKNRSEGLGTWNKLSQTQSWKSWSGYAFENIGLKHLDQIKDALRIGGIYSEASSFSFRGTEELPGCQIDLLIDRNDHVINICELKFYKQEFLMSKAYAQELRTKILSFKTATKTRKRIFVTFISAFPLMPNQHSIGLIDQAFDMNIFFD